ncbi:hypothetical protein SAMN05444170_0858 [Bradyrhizobium erythrophlei]|uniref:Uncharacterized protein n=1 Tax=Bradyrhizobium erythrophlei TaxID=1437360 RepID=A0A1M7T602_9BRAD|nr:hypothetical protein SAMN05444170_0858 [Bradyrhizobium erythrophlei]
MLQGSGFAPSANFRASAGPLAWRFGGLFGQKFFEKLQGIGANCPGNCDELYNVDPPLAALIFGNKGLRPPELRGQCLLANAGFMSRCDKNLDEAAIFRGFEGFLHDRRASESAAGNLIPKTDYPKTGY